MARSVLQSCVVGFDVGLRGVDLPENAPWSPARGPPIRPPPPLHPPAPRPPLGPRSRFTDGPASGRLRMPRARLGLAWFRRIKGSGDGDGSRGKVFGGGRERRVAEGEGFDEGEHQPAFGGWS